MSVELRPILERFHLNHRMAFPDEASDEIEAIEHELLHLGAHCVLLTVSSEHVEQRMQSRSPHEWTNKSREEMNNSAEEFVRTQSELRKQSCLSVVPTTEINTDDKDWNLYASRNYLVVLQKRR